MRALVAWFLVSSLGSLTGCSSTPLDSDGKAGVDPGSAGSNSSGSDGGSGPDLDPGENACRSALRQSIGLVDEASMANVTLLGGDAGDALLFVDASAGGIDGQDTHPWVYISLANAGAATMTDLEALDSTAWDLAFKRFLIRTNGGDSGPGRGGALRVALAWDDVTEETLGNVSLPTEDWFDDECNLTTNDNGELVTTFTGWSAYDEANHVLEPAEVVFITAGADGALYKVQIQDYYATPQGAHGNVAGRYLVHVAPLP